MSLILKNASKIGFIRIIARIIGLLSTFVIARLLTPDDYAVIAVCMIAQDLAYRLEDIGLNSNLVSQKNVSDEFEKGLITVKLIVGASLFSAVYMSSGYMSVFFEDSRIESVMQVIAFVFIIKPFSNLRLSLEVRKENFNPTLKTMLYSKLVSSIITISLAFYLENYWALALGIVISNTLYVVISYMVAKPFFYLKWYWKEVKDILSFSKWFTFKQVVEFINIKSTILFVSKIFDSKTVGYFSLGNQICMMPGQEISSAIDQSNMSNLAKQKHETSSFRPLLLNNMKFNLTTKTLILSPVYAAFCVFPDTITHALLGDNWIGIGFYFTFFAISAFLISLGASYTSYLLLYRAPKLVMFINFTILILRLVSLYITYLYQNILFLLSFSIILNILRNVLQIYYINKKEKLTIMPFLTVYTWCNMVFLALITAYLGCSLITENMLFNLVLSLILTPFLYLTYQRIAPNTDFAIAIASFKSMVITKLKSKGHD